jgi:hypothetical protein
MYKKYFFKFITSLKRKRIRIQIPIRIKKSDPDMYQIEKQDPNPDQYQSEKQDPDPNLDPYQKGLDPQHGFLDILPSKWLIPFTCL